MVNYWERAEYAKDIGEMKGLYLDCKSKRQRTNQMFDFFDKNCSLDITNVIEPGCNVGRNLEMAYERYGCNVVGLDINKEAISECKSRMATLGEFYIKDMLSYSFDDYEDGFFDLGITMGFLMHIERGGQKKKIINGLLRSCKHVLMYEVYSDDADKKDLVLEEDHVVSWEDYRTYNDKIIDTGISFGKNLKLYYYKGEIINENYSRLI